MINSCRKADFRIDSEGTWYYGEMEMTRRDIVALFYRHLLRDTSGQYFLEIGSQRCQVDVEDTAYVVWAVIRAGNGESGSRIYLFLSDDTIEELDPATLRIGKSNVPYCRVKDGGFAARFSTSSYYQLAEHISHDSACDKYYISIGGQFHYIPELQKD